MSQRLIGGGTIATTAAGGGDRAEGKASGIQSWL
jgi:hypothetical protein